MPINDKLLSNQNFVNPFYNEGAGRRTGWEQKKEARKDSDGFEIFDDYWSDSDQSSLSVDITTAGKENKSRSRNKTSKSNIVTPIARKSSPLKPMSSFSSEPLSTESSQPNKSAITTDNITQDLTPKAVQEGDLNGSLSMVDASSAPNSALQSFKTKKRLTFSAAEHLKRKSACNEAEECVQPEPVITAVDARHRHEEDDDDSGSGLDTTLTADDANQVVGSTVNGDVQVKESSIAKCQVVTENVQASSRPQRSIRDRSRRSIAGELLTVADDTPISGSTDVGTDQVDSNFISFKSKSVVNSTQINSEIDNNDDDDDDDDDFDIVDIKTSVYVQGHESSKKSRGPSKSTSKSKLASGNEGDGLPDGDKVTASTKRKRGGARKNETQASQLVNESVIVTGKPTKSTAKNRSRSHKENKSLHARGKWDDTEDEDDDDDEEEEELSTSLPIKATSQRKKGKKVMGNEDDNGSGIDDMNGRDEEKVLTVKRTGRSRKKQELLQEEKAKQSGNEGDGLSDDDNVTASTKKKRGGARKNETQASQLVNESVIMTGKPAKSTAKNRSRSRKENKSLHARGKWDDTEDEDDDEEELSTSLPIKATSQRKKGKKVMGNEDDNGSGIDDMNGRDEEKVLTVKRTGRSRKKQELLQEEKAKQSGNEGDGLSDGDNVTASTKMKRGGARKNETQASQLVNESVIMTGKPAKSTAKNRSRSCKENKSLHARGKWDDTEDEDEDDDEEELSTSLPIKATSQRKKGKKVMGNEDDNGSGIDDMNGRDEEKVLTVKRTGRSWKKQELLQEEKAKQSGNEGDGLSDDDNVTVSTKKKRGGTRKNETQANQLVNESVIVTGEPAKSTAKNRSRSRKEIKSLPARRKWDDIEDEDDDDDDDELSTSLPIKATSQRKTGKKVMGNEDDNGSGIDMNGRDEEKILTVKRTGRSRKKQELLQEEKAKPEKRKKSGKKTSDEETVNLAGDNGSESNNVDALVVDTMMSNSRPKRASRRKAKLEHFQQTDTGGIEPDRLNKTAGPKGTNDGFTERSTKASRSRRNTAKSVEGDISDTNTEPAAKVNPRKRSKSLYNPENGVLDEQENNLQTSHQSVVHEVIVSNLTAKKKSKAAANVKKKGGQRKSSVRFSLDGELNPAAIETDTKTTTNPRRSILSKKSHISPKQMTSTDDDYDDGDFPLQITKSSGLHQTYADDLEDLDSVLVEEFENDAVPSTKKKAIKRKKEATEDLQRGAEVNVHADDSLTAKHVKRTPKERKSGKNRKQKREGGKSSSSSTASSAEEEFIYRPVEMRTLGSGISQRAICNQTDVLAHSQFGDDDMLECETPMRAPSGDIPSNSILKSGGQVESSGKTVRHAANMTIKYFEVPRKKAFIIDPEISEDGIRRTKRHRVKPLEFWRNERPIYQRRKSGGFALSGIQSPTIPTPSPPTVKQRKKGKRIPETPHNLSIHTDLSDIEVEERVHPTITVINPSTEEEVEIDAVTTSEMNQFFGPTGKPTAETDPIAMSKCLYQKSFSAGELLIRPLQEKGLQFVRNDTMVFRILRGKLAVTIHETTTILESGAMFFIPKGNVYNIKNLRNDEAKLVFIQVKSLH